MDTENRSQLQQALQKTYYDVAEPWVQERTAELRVANKLLQHEITERQRIEEKIKQRNRELAALNAIATAANRHLHLGDVLDVSVEKVMDIVEADAGCVLLVEVSSHKLRVWGEQGLSPELVQQFEAMMPGEDYWQQGAPLDATDLWRISDSVKAIARNAGVISCILLPLRWENTATGIMLLTGCGDNVFVQWSMEFLMTVSDQLSMAVRNAQLYNEAQLELSERKRAEKALRESEERYRGLFEGVPVGLYRITPDGRFRDANAAMLKMLDYPDKESLLAVPSVDLQVSVTPEDRQWRQAMLGRDGTLRDLEVQLRRRDGGVIWVRSHFRAARDAAGQALYYEGSVEDITERKQAQAALQKAHDELEMRVQERTAELAQTNEALQAEIIERKRAEEAMRRERDLAEALAKAAAIISSTLDPDQVLDHILEQTSRVVPNNAANVMLIEDNQVHMARWRGYEQFGAEEYISTLEFHVLEMSSLQQMMESGQPLIIPDTATYPGWVHVPEMEWLRSYAAAPIIVRGQVTGFLNVDSAALGFFTQAHTESLRAFADHTAAAIENAQLYEAAQREITERKRAEEELRDREATMRALLNAPIDIAILIDANGIIRGANEAASKMLGKSVDELISLCIYDLFPPALAKSRKAQADKVFRSGSPVRFEDQRVGISFDHNLYPIFDAEGKVTQIAVYARDITYRKQADEQLRAYQERLRSLASQLSLTEEKERRRIATELHDSIGQTLAICKIQLGVLRQSASSTELVEPLEEIHQYIEDIIRDTRSLTFEISSPILYQLGLESALEWLAERTQKRDGVRAKFRNDGQPKPLDDDIRIVLFQAVRELLINVVKHAQAQRVEVAIGRDDRHVRIAVEDDGVGFDVFPIGSHWSEVKGFGLFSIRERLGHLGGQLQIKSKPGLGTRVTLLAPLSSDQ